MGRVWTWWGEGVHSRKYLLDFCTARMQHEPKFFFSFARQVDVWRPPCYQLGLGVTSEAHNFSLFSLFSPGSWAPTGSDKTNEKNESRSTCSLYKRADTVS